MIFCTGKAEGRTSACLVSTVTLRHLHATVSLQQNKQRIYRSKCVQISEHFYFNLIVHELRILSMILANSSGNKSFLMSVVFSWTTAPPRGWVERGLNLTYVIWTKGASQMNRWNSKTNDFNWRKKKTHTEKRFLLFFHIAATRFENQIKYCTKI